MATFLSSLVFGLQAVNGAESGKEIIPTTAFMTMIGH
jgi:hypothetical protein